MFIEDIISTLQKSGVQSIKIGKSDTNIILYADDMIVLAYNVFDLQDEINVVVQYFSVHNLQIKQNKRQYKTSICISASKFEICKAKGVLG
jgi:hypothetical protein